MSKTSPSGLTTRQQYVMVGVMFVIMGLTAGLVVYSMAIFIDELTTTGGFSLPLVSLAVSLSSFASGFGGLVAARAMKGMSFRTLFMIGVVGGALGLIWVGRASEPWQLYLAFSLMGFALALMGYVPCTDLLARAFHPSPARAITIASVGFSAGGATVPTAVNALVAAFGLDGATVVIAISLVVVMAISVAVLKEPRPIAPEVAPPPTEEEDTLALPPNAVVDGSSWRRLMVIRLPRIPPRVLPLAIGLGLIILSQSGTVTHLLRIGRERDVPDAAYLLSIIAITSIVTRFAGVFVVNRLRLRWFAVWVSVALVIAQVIFAVASDVTGLVVAALFMGINVGYLIVMNSLFVLAGFDRASYASMYALVALGFTAGSGLGPLLLGLAASALGSYGVPLLGLGVLTLVGLGVLLSTGIDNNPRENRL